MSRTTTGVMMISDLQARKVNAHRANIDRYCKLLATPLTDLERNYIHKRIAEERRALERQCRPACNPEASPSWVAA